MNCWCVQGVLLSCPENSWHKLLNLRAVEMGIENGWLDELAAAKLCLIFLLVLLCMSALSGSGKMYNYIITWKQLIHRDRVHTGVTGLSKMLTLCFYGNMTTHWSYCHTWRQELQWQQRNACWWFGDEMKRNQVGRESGHICPRFSSRPVTVHHEDFL